MKFPTAEILSLVFQLLPGFVVAWIFYALTAHLKKDQFEQTIQALIFTGIVKAIVVPIKWLALYIGSQGCSIGEWNADGEHVLSFLIAIVLGILFSSIVHTDFYRDCRSQRVNDWIKKWITKKTCFPSEWFSAFNRTEMYVSVRLKNDKRIQGWPEEYPDDPSTGHLVLMDAAWVNEDGTREKIAGVERMLIPVDQITLVEFVDFDSESNEHLENKSPESHTVDSVATDTGASCTIK